jgi:hypothetical protein
LAAQIVKLLALATVLASAAATVVAMLLIFRTPPEVIPVGYRPAEMLPFVALQIAFTAVGALLVWRRPENLIGRLFCGQALTIAGVLLLAGLVVQAISAGEAASAARAAWVSAWLMNGLTVTLAPALVLFPDGRLTSRAARASLAFLALAMVLITPVLALRPGSLASFPAIANPYPWHDHGGALDAAFAVGLAAGGIGAALALWSQITRFRRSSGTERQQLKWFLTSMFVVLLALVPMVALLYGESEATAESARRYAGRAIAALATSALPVAIGVAVLRYRLYDIDVLINRALVYGALSALLFGTYVLSVLALSTLLRPLTGSGDIAVAGSTLAVFALFGPLRSRVQRAVDRRFYRARYDAARTLDAFGARLRDEVDLDSVRAELLGVVRETVHPAHASVWLRERAR